jgi:hypothetical protein
VVYFILFYFIPLPPPPPLLHSTLDYILVTFLYRVNYMQVPTFTVDVHFLIHTFIETVSKKKIIRWA